MGFRVMVAPINSVAREAHASSQDNASLGPLQECPSGLHAEAKSSPPLHSFIREILQARGFSEAQISSHLRKPPPRRYDSAFALLYAMAVRRGYTVHSPLDAFVGLLIDMHSFSPSNALNAYCALLLIPGFDQIKFHPLIAPYRKVWNKSEPKYAAFWDPMPVFMAFLNTSYDHNVVAQLRLKLILLWRFLGLFRSIDLSRVRRDLSSIWERRFIVVRRKNQRNFRWEEVLVLRDTNYSPWHVLQQYVSLTSKQVPPGGPLLVTLKRPFTGLTSNTIASLVRPELKRFGVPVDVFGPHTTRGAFVDFYRQLGLPSEVVSTIGLWDNMQAFAKHYLRIGASHEAREALNSFMVHRTSPEIVGESNVPRTHQEPAPQVTRGGSGTVQAHTSTGEPSLPNPVQRKRTRSSSPFSLCKAPRLLSTSSSGRRVTRFDYQHVQVDSSDSMYEEESEESL